MITGNARQKLAMGRGGIALTLQVISALLLAMLIYLVIDIGRKYQILEDGVRENAIWSVYQLDREVRQVNHALAGFGGRQPKSEGVSELALRYDILYSRVSLVDQSKFGAFFSEDEEVRGFIARISEIIFRAQPMFDAYLAGTTPTAAELAAFETQMSALGKLADEFLLYTNMRVSAERSELSANINSLERTSGVMLGLLMISVVFLIVTLNRQLRSVRKASRELSEMAAKLTEAYEAADAGNRAKSQFMATMGHEIRTPLNAILGMSELLELGDLPQEALSSVKTIRTSGEALLEMINEILDFSKIEHGKLEIEERVFEIENLAESTVRIIRGRADEHGNSVILDLPESLRTLHVKSDPTRLRQVLLNLLSNAVKFTDHGTVTLRLREFYREGQLMVRFEVEDTGIGIDQAGLDKLFKPFSQVDASISRRYGGTGLGLTICKEIVEKLGGELGMSSTVGVGSIFWFELPVSVAERDEQASETARKNLDTPLQRHRILLVEDNKVNQIVASRFLALLGQDVVIANDGAEAVSIARDEQFDLILMDMQMPVMDGIEATRRIIAEGGPSSAVPIFAMTANASDDDRKTCLDAGMRGFESKPVTMERLKKMIAQATEGQAEDMDKFKLKPSTAMELPQAEISGVLENDSILTAGVEGLDAARYRELVDALGKDVFKELVMSFFEDASGLLDELNSAFARRDADGIDRVLHTIKGAAYNVGLNDLAVKANALRSPPPGPADIETLGEEIRALKYKLVA